jgi:lysozyme family protein
MSVRPTYAQSKKGFTNLLSGVKVTNAPMAQAAAKHALKYKQQYIDAAKKCTPPAPPPYWFMGIHFREADNNMRCCLANGDPIIGTGRRTWDVPAGLGPYRTFADSANDGVRYERFGKTFWAEFAYAAYAAQCWHGWGTKTNDSYVWRATSREQPGMWVADHVFDRSKMDPRPGVVALWLELFKLDPSLKPKDPAPSTPLVVPTVTSVAVGWLAPDMGYIVGALFMTFLYVLRWYIQHGARDMPNIFTSPKTTVAGVGLIFTGLGALAAAWSHGQLDPQGITTLLLGIGQLFGGGGLVVAKDSDK